MRHLHSISPASHFPADMRRIDMTPRNLANNELLLTFSCRPESPAGHTNPREFSFDPDS